MKKIFLIILAVLLITIYISATNVKPTKVHEKVYPADGSKPYHQCINDGKNCVV